MWIGGASKQVCLRGELHLPFLLLLLLLIVCLCCCCLHIQPTRRPAIIYDTPFLLRLLLLLLPITPLFTFPSPSQISVNNWIGCNLCFVWRFVWLIKFFWWGETGEEFNPIKCWSASQPTSHSLIVVVIFMLLMMHSSEVNAFLLDGWWFFAKNVQPPNCKHHSTFVRPPVHTHKYPFPSFPSFPCTFSRPDISAPLRH